VAAADWEAFGSTGLADRLIADGLLVEHEPADPSLAVVPGAVAVIRPRRIGFISCRTSGPSPSSRRRPC